jgi:hypothetical protein
MPVRSSHHKQHLNPSQKNWNSPILGLNPLYDPSKSSTARVLSPQPPRWSPRSCSGAASVYNPQLSKSFNTANWTIAGIAVRLWQLGIEMRPLFERSKLWVYPLYATVGGGFGYWLQDVAQGQKLRLAEKRESLLLKRKRRAEREAEAVEEEA